MPSGATYKINIVYDEPFWPGVLTGFGPALRQPCGRIHWAGTERVVVASRG